MSENFENHKRRMITAARQKWQDIGYDCLLAIAADQGVKVYSVTIPADEVIDIVADFMCDVPGWNQLALDVHDEILKEAFSQHSYGT